MIKNCMLCNQKGISRVALLRRDDTGTHGLESKCRMCGAALSAFAVCCFIVRGIWAGEI